MKKEEIVAKIKEIRTNCNRDSPYEDIIERINDNPLHLQQAKKFPIANKIIDRIRKRLLIEINYMFEKFFDNQKYINTRLLKEIRNKDEIIKFLQPNIARLEQETDDMQETLNLLNYQKFEDKFRGTEKEIKKKLEKYLKYINKNDIVLDIGCGRGDFLDLLKQREHNYIGIDDNRQMIERCEKKNLNVKKKNAIQYLRQLKTNSLGTITAFHVIEHLKFKDLLELVQNCQMKLKKGGVLIFETPNPGSLSIYYNSFYIDPSHIKPIPHQLISFLLEENGFKIKDIIFSAPVKNCLVGNEKDIKKLNEIVFGPQDYGIIAVKK